MTTTLNKLGRSIRRSYRRTLVGPYRSWTARRSDVLRVVIGSSGWSDRGWIATDVEFLDVTNESHWARFCEPGTVDAILAEHVWEHLLPEDASRGAEMCHKYLRRGGYLRVAVPDGCHPDARYIERVKPGGTGAGAHDHKTLYTYQTLSATFSGVGCEINLLEYFDDAGRFHCKDWDPSGGVIRRSFRFDERNRNGATRYTSIILDAYKVI
jgi:predicted SAM-dependent methyltransferase